MFDSQGQSRSEGQPVVLQVGFSIASLMENLTWQLVWRHWLKFSWCDTAPYIIVTTWTCLEILLYLVYTKVCLFVFILQRINNKDLYFFLNKSCVSNGGVWLWPHVRLHWASHTQMVSFLCIETTSSTICIRSIFLFSFFFSPPPLPLS